MAVIVLHLFNLPVFSDDSINTQLYGYYVTKRLTDKDLRKINTIIALIDTCGAEFVKFKQDTSLYGFTSIIYSELCVKVNSSYSIQSYIKYLLKRNNSACEALSSGFELIFSKNPVLTLKRINKYKNKQKDYLLDHLIWGFINTWYRKVGEYNQKDGVLKPENCEKYFYIAYPSLKNNYKLYKGPIDYFIQRSKYLLTEN